MADSLPHEHYESIRRLRKALELSGDSNFDDASSDFSSSASDAPSLRRIESLSAFALPTKSPNHCGSADEEGDPARAIAAEFVKLYARYDDVEATLAEKEAYISQMEQEYHAELDRYRLECASLNDRLVDSEASVARLRDSNDVQVEEIRLLEATVLRLDKSKDKLKANIKQLGERLHNARFSRHSSRQRISSLEAQIRAQGKELDAKDSAIQRCAKEIEKLKAAFKVSEDVIATRGVIMTQKDAIISTKIAIIKAKSDRIKTLKTSVADLHTQLSTSAKSHERLCYLVSTFWSALKAVGVILAGVALVGFFL